jgi:hypothetical protein
LIVDKLEIDRFRHIHTAEMWSFLIASFSLGFSLQYNPPRIALEYLSLCTKQISRDMSAGRALDHRDVSISGNALARFLGWAVGRSSVAVVGAVYRRHGLGRYQHRMKVYTKRVRENGKKGRVDGIAVLVEIMIEGRA